MGQIGYGVAIDSVKWKKNAAEILIDRNFDKSGLLQEEWNCYMEDNGLEENANPRAFAEDMISMYDDGQHHDGIEGLIVNLLNESLESIGYEEAFYYEDGRVYVPTDLPFTREDKEKMLCCEEIGEMLAELLNPLAEEPVTVDWQDIETIY